MLKLFAIDSKETRTRKTLAMYFEKQLRAELHFMFNIPDPSAEMIEDGINACMCRWHDTQEANADPKWAGFQYQLLPDAFDFYSVCKDLVEWYR